MAVDLREELAQLITLRDDDFDFEGEMPEMSFELDDCHWQGAEPDVGIMSDYLDDYSVSYSIGDDTYDNDAAFYDALMSLIGEHVEETREQIAAHVEKLVEKEAAEMEPPEPDYYDYD